MRSGTLYVPGFQPASSPPPSLTSPKKPSGRVTDTCSRKSLACKSYGKENSESGRNHKISQNLVRGGPTPESVFLTMDILLQSYKMICKHFIGTTEEKVLLVSIKWYRVEYLYSNHDY